ncbi:MAG: hypothetical protein K1X79_14060, partial [Oligoflexia bacterium]|nr:hypothetical protein [Oligoflexia bacterium]
LYAWEERGLQRYPWAALVFLVAATLAKGPVGLLLPLAIFGGYLLLRGHRFWPSFRNCCLLGAPALIIAGSWYVLAFSERGEAFWAKIYYENIARFTSTMDDEPHKHSGFYLLGTWLLGYMPWTLFFLPLALIERKRALVFVRNLRERLRLGPDFIGFSLLTCLVVFAFFLIPSSKRSVYLLPAYPFLCFLSAHFLEFIFGERPDQLERVAKLLVALSLAILVLGVSVLSTGLLSSPDILRLSKDSSDLRFIAKVLRIDNSMPWYALVPLCIPPGIAAVVLVHLQRSAIQFKSAAGVALVFLATQVVADSFFVSRYTLALSPKKFAEEIDSRVPTTAQVYSFGSEFYGLSFYAARKIYRAEEGRPPGGGFIVAYEQDIPLLRTKFPDLDLETIAKSANAIVKPERRVVLFRVRA